MNGGTVSPSPSSAPAGAFVGRSPLGDLAGWVTDVVERLGYAGVALLVALESLVPPVPSELILPLAGYLTGQGRLWYPAVVLAALTLLGVAAARRAECTLLGRRPCRQPAAPPGRQEAAVPAVEPVRTAHPRAVETRAIGAVASSPRSRRTGPPRPQAWAPRRLVRGRNAPVAAPRPDRVTPPR